MSSIRGFSTVAFNQSFSSPRSRVVDFLELPGAGLAVAGIQQVAWLVHVSKVWVNDC